MTSKYRKASSTPLRCMSPAPSSKRRTGRTGNKDVLPSYIPYLR